MAESADTVDGNKIGNFRPKGGLQLNQMESVGTYRPESAAGFPMSPNSPTKNMSMEHRLLQKDKKKSVISQDLPLEPAGGGCCQGKPCSIF